MLRTLYSSHELRYSILSHCLHFLIHSEYSYAIPIHLSDQEVYQRKSSSPQRSDAPENQNFSHLMGPPNVFSYNGQYLTIKNAFNPSLPLPVYEGNSSPHYEGYAEMNKSNYFINYLKGR